MTKFIYYAFWMLVPVMGWAVDCAPGAYWTGTECKICDHSDAYYCPGTGGGRVPCQSFDAVKLRERAGAVGWSGAELYAWGGGAAGPSLATHCALVYNLGMVQGLQHRECHYNPASDVNYYCESIWWWYVNPGYYLVNKYAGNLWSGVMPCTNITPANSHYAAERYLTEDNCPWECDNGYGRHGDACYPLCAAGATRLYAGGNSYNMYADKHTTPAIAVGIGDRKCYTCLESGAGGLTLQYGGAPYHAVD